jgi:cystathionine beta-lyase
MTHKSIPSERRRAAGVSDSLIRLSVGLEETTDLVLDLQQALDKLNRVTFSHQCLAESPAL